MSFTEGIRTVIPAGTPTEHIKGIADVEALMQTIWGKTTALRLGEVSLGYQRKAIGVND